MPYLFKLTKRMALAWATVLAPLGFSACSHGDAPGSPLEPSAGLSSARRAAASVTLKIPGTVTDLAVESASDTSASLSFTQVSDGNGHPASYAVRYATAPISWGSAATVVRGTCSMPVAVTSVGAPLTCTVLGLKAATAYNFQLVAFRTQSNGSFVYGGLSNIAAGPTAPVAVGSVTVSPGSAAVAIGAAIALTATVRDAANNVLTGRSVVWSSSNIGIATVSSNGIVTGVGAGVGTLTATAGGKSGEGAVTIASPTPVLPGTVGDLSAIATTQTSVTLRFTQVNDGAGGAARYAVRYSVTPISWGSATMVSSGTCAAPATTSVGAPLSCTVTGLNSSTTYGLQLVTYRTDLTGVNAYGTLSNIATATTGQASSPAPGGAGSPLLVEDFSSYATTANLVSNPRNVFMKGEDQGVAGTYTTLALDQSGANPRSANGQSMRYDFKDRTGDPNRCADFGVTRTLALNSAHDAGSGPGEVWVEVWAKFTANWTATAPSAWGCTSGRDYKFLFGQVYGPQTGRFDYEMNDTDWYWNDPDNHLTQGVNTPSPKSAQDGTWHRFRTHYKVSSAANVADGAYQAWIDNSLILDRRNIVINRAGLWGVKLGANLNQGPATLQSVSWGYVALYVSNPGW